MLITVLLAAASLCGPDPDGVVVTAPATPVALDAAAAPEAASPQAAARAQSQDPHGLTTNEHIDQWLAARDPDGSAWADEDMGPVDDRQVHGQVSAGVGTGGYRQYGAAVSVPIGDSGRLDLSYSQVENAPWGRYGYGYGESGFDSPAYVFPGAERRSFRAAGFEGRIAGADARGRREAASGGEE